MVTNLHLCIVVYIVNIHYSLACRGRKGNQTRNISRPFVLAGLYMVLLNSIPQARGRPSERAHGGAAGAAGGLLML